MEKLKNFFDYIPHFLISAIFGLIIGIISSFAMTSPIKITEIRTEQVEVEKEVVVEKKIYVNDELEKCNGLGGDFLMYKPFLEDNYKISCDSPRKELFEITP